MMVAVVSGLVAFLQIGHIERKVVQLAEVPELLGEAAREIEIDVAETARSTAPAAASTRSRYGWTAIPRGGAH
jgi:hypothetical protein